MSGSEPRYRADPADAVLDVALEELTALYHRPSGTTHVLAPPSPQILESLREADATLIELEARMGARFEMIGDIGALAARLEELVAAGLVERS